MAKAAESAGADAVSLINTITGMKIDIAPPETGQFSDTAAGSQKHSDHRQPVPVIVRFLQKPDQYTLLFLSKCPAAVP